MIPVSILQQVLAPLPDPVRPIALARALGASRTTVMRWVDLGFLPPPLQLGSTRFWTKSSLLDHIVARQGVGVE